MKNEKNIVTLGSCNSGSNTQHYTMINKTIEEQEADLDTLGRPIGSDGEVTTGLI